MLWWAKALSGTLSTAAGLQFGTQWVSSAQGGAKALEKQHSEIARGRRVSSPSSQALRHHFLHHHLCSKDARLNLLSGDIAEPSSRPHATAYGSCNGLLQSTVHAVSTSLSPGWLGNPSSKGVQQLHQFTQSHTTGVTMSATLIRLIDAESDGNQNTVKAQVYKEHSSSCWQGGLVLQVYGWHLPRHSSDRPVPPYHPLLSASHAATPRRLAPQSCQC